jgi:hypothetical protein
MRELGLAEFPARLLIHLVGDLLVHKPGHRFSPGKRRALALTVEVGGLARR